MRLTCMFHLFALIGSNTGALLLHRRPQVLTTTGATLPVKEIAAVAKAAGAMVVVDGAQSMGMELNVTELGAGSPKIICGTKH